MRKTIIRCELHFARVDYITIRVERYTEPRVPHPTVSDLASCPERFRCYACLVVKGKNRHFAELMLNKRICRKCYPYLDEQDVQAIIAFDRRHGFSVD